MFRNYVSMFQEVYDEIYTEYHTITKDDNNSNNISQTAFKQILEDKIGLKHFKMRKEVGDNPRSAFKNILLCRD